MITTAQELGGNSLTTLITIDFSTCIAFKPTGTGVVRMSANRNGTADIVYDGHTYQYVGFEADGFRSEINGAVPTPTISFDKASLVNLAAFVTIWDEYIAQTGEDYFDPRGARISILRVVNLSTSQETNLQEYVVSQANKITPNVIEWQLAISLGVDRLVGDSITRLSVNRCALRYRRWNATLNDFDYTDEDAGGCPYGNPTTISNWSAVPGFGIKWFNRDDVELTAPNKNLDACSYSVKGCQSRFDPAENGLTLPFVGLYSPNTLGKQ